MSPCIPSFFQAASSENDMSLALNRYLCEPQPLLPGGGPHVLPAKVQPQHRVQAVQVQVPHQGPAGDRLRLPHLIHKVRYG